MRVLPAGPYGVVLEFGHGVEARRCYGRIERLRTSAIVDVVPAERTVLVVSRFDAAGRSGLRELISLLAVDEDGAGDGDGAVIEGGRSDADALADGPIVELPVHYDGPDLDEVASLTGLPTSEIVRLHADTEFTVAFTGFAPGFAYLVGLPETLEVPRRTVPRTRVETGSVGLAGPYSGVYPRASPGGWQIIGHLGSDAEALWDTQRAAPALLRPGTRVRFRAIDAP